ncbi:transmembrane protein, putative (macronuclear) [Tetrahymena thermophila SB210]|uniref:Transmembrane protein, putative n=1 Tax=Tetrahymena thermophila (strain SB210) TaxID=312017 RepID=X1W3U5_TETTS|nr:transmembrane protein, putative [Tetrahymena thermophila SB210]EAR95315.2 transmembrane protein, putative [Tetrahymena thermophila SB210]|eukprot:XP_001015560.2 transmembrane protein, putative [Tetrahymena thermophila SB210]
MALQQAIDSTGQIQNKCVAICQQQQYLNGLTNTCQSLSQCSSSYFTSTSSTTNSNNIIDLKMLNDSSLLAFYSNFMSQIRVDTGQLELSLSYGAQAIKSQYFNGLYYIFKTDNSIILWEVEFDKKLLVSQIQFGVNQIKVYSQQLQNLITVNQDNGIINYLAIIGNGLQIISKSNNQQQQQQKQIISSQFQPNYITNQGIVTDILIFDDLNALATCSKEGRLFVWDITKVYDAQFSYLYYNNQDSCLKLYRLSIYQIIALFQNTIVILDIRQSTPLKVIQKNNPNPTKEFITSNKNLGILIYDGILNCIKNDGSLLFSTNDPSFTQNIYNIYISYNNLLFFQYQNQMKVYKVDPTQNTIQNQMTLFSTYNSPSKVNIQLSKIKPFPESLYSSVGYTFEVVIFDTSSSFYIFDEQFHVLQQVNQVPLISAVDFNFLISNPLDPNYFVMGYTTQQTAAFKFQVYNIQKGVNAANLAAFIVSGSYLMEPRKVPNKPSQYDLEIVIPLSYFTSNNVFRYDTNVAANVFQMGKQIQNEIQSIYKTFPDLSYNFFGGQSGFVGISPLNTNYVKQVFSLSSNDIINVQQCYSLGVYFVISKKIQIVNIHTNSLIEEIIFKDTTQQSVQGFQIFADLQIAIAFKSSQLILKNFKDGQTYSYTNINNLSFYNLEKENQLITIFGSKVVKLQLNLNEYQQIGALILQNNYIVGCVLSSVNYYCVTVMQRGSLVVRTVISSPGGGNIVQLMYLPNQNHILFFTTQMRFGQIFVYSLSTLLQVTSIKNTYTQNPISLTCAMIYDIFQNYLVYIDLTGNILIISYTGAYSMVNFLKMNQFDDGFSAPIGFSLDFDMNNILVYSSSNVFQIPYSSINLWYNRIINYPKNQYFALNSGQNSEQYFIVGTQNILYTYQNNQFQSFNYFNEDDRLSSVSYIPDQQLLIVGFTQQINIYQQFSSNNLSLSNKVIITGYKLKEFITPNIFLTFENSIVDYNFQQNSENYKITWNLGVSITSYLWLNSSSLIIVGFNTGDLLFYNYQLQKQTNINVDSTPIIFIQEGLNSIWACSVIGIIQQISTSSQQTTQTFNLASIVTLQQADKINVFSIDEQNQRIFVSLLEQYLLYIFSYSTQALQIQQYLSFPHHEKNNIYFSKNYLIMYSTSQINIHNRSSLQFLKSLKRENVYDQIMSIYFVNETYLIIPFQRKLELYSYDVISNTMQFLDQIITILPQVIKTQIISNGQQLQLIGFSNNMVFENRYSVQLISSQSTQCSLNIDVQDYTSTQQQLSLIPPTTVPYFTWQNRITVTSSNSNNYFYMNMFSDNLDLVSTSSTQNTLLVIQSPINSNNNLINGMQTISLSNQIFAQFSKQQVLLNSLQFQLIDTSNYQSSIVIAFNSFVQQVSFQNIVLPNQKTLSQAQFQFKNMKTIVFNNIVIDKWNLLQNLRNLQQQQQTASQLSSQNSGFFNFQNCSSVYLYGISIKNSIINISNFSTLFLFNTINEVILEDFYVENLQTIVQLATFQNVQKITIKNLTISDSQFLLSKQSSTSLNQFIIQISGCQNTIIQNSLFTSNQNMLFLNTKNYIVINQQLVYLESDQLTLLNIRLENNQNIQQNTGLAIMSISSSINNLDTLNITQNQFNIQFESTVSIFIQNSVFQYNIGINGGALSIINNIGSVIIQRSQFLFNKAQGSGGAIYLNLAQGSVNLDQSNQISNNKAIIGGGIRLYSYANSIQVSIHKGIIENNNADIYGNNFATFLESIFASCSNMNCFFNKSNNQLSIERFNSGDTAHLSIIFLDQDGRSMSFDPSKVDSNSYPSEIIDEIKSYQLQVTTSLNGNEKININGENFISYNRFSQNTSAFELNNFQILSIPQTTQQININYQILPTKIQQLSNSSKNSILTSIQFRECIVGEIMKAYSQTIFSCQKCLAGTYSFAETDLIMENKQGQIQCKKCPYSAISCEGNQIQLKNSYWKMNDTTDEIIYCVNNPNSCQSENSESRKGCIKGYIGPLCETCDLIGDVWDGQRYTKSLSSSYECSQCSSLYYQIIFIVLSILFLSIYFLMSLEIFMNNFYHSQLCHYLRFLQIIPISQSQIKDRSSLYIKILTNYIQNSSVLINYSYYFIPSLISVIPNSFGQPSNKLVIGLQCLLSIQYLKKNGILQTVSIFQSLIPLIFIFLLTLILFIAFLIKRGKFQKAKFYTLYNILFVFFQPDQVTFLTKLLSCRQIGSYSYASENLLLLCDDDNYQSFQRKFAIPLLVFWIGVPVISLIAIYKKRNKLNTCYTQYRLGYFTTGFKQKFFYWEFVRIKIYLGKYLDVSLDLFYLKTFEKVETSEVLNLNVNNTTIKDSIMKNISKSIHNSMRLISNLTSQQNDVQLNQTNTIHHSSRKIICNKIMQFKV